MVWVITEINVLESQENQMLPVFQNQPNFSQCNPSTLQQSSGRDADRKHRTDDARQTDFKVKILM